MFDSLSGAEQRSAQQHPADIVTVVNASMQGRLDLALGGLARPVHLASIAAALTVVREQPIRAVLLGQESVSPDSAVAVGRIANTCGGTVIAVADGWTPNLPEALLTFGRYGVRETVDLSNRTGMSRLRELLTRPEWELANRIEKTFEQNLKEATDEMRAFVHHVVHVAPSVSSVKALAKGLGVRHSSLVSRFFRARLPSPKKYLAFTRLLYVAAILEDTRIPAAHAARRLNYSSPQSFMRHVREQLGVSVHDFRERYSFDDLASHVSFHTLTEYQDTLRWFRPLGTAVWEADE
jgi:AraC-like DNA-binding protein